MSDLESNSEYQSEEGEIQENTAQELEAAQSALEETTPPDVQPVEESTALTGDVVESVHEASVESGEIIEDTTGELESSWQPEPVDFSAASGVPASETPTPEAAPAEPEAWDSGRTPERQVPPPVLPPPPVNEPLSADDERTWALLAHLSVLINLVTGFLGPVAALVIYFAFKYRSRYVRYHAMQSFIFQLLWWIGGGILVALLWISVGVLAFVLVGLCLIPFALAACLLPLGALVYGVIGGIQVSQGQDFRYWLVGDWVRGELTGD